MSSSHRGDDTVRGKWCQLDKDSRDSINVFSSLSDVIHCCLSVWRVFMFASVRICSVRETVPVSRNLNFSSAALFVYYCPRLSAYTCAVRGRWSGTGTRDVFIQHGNVIGRRRRVTKQLAEKAANLYHLKASVLARCSWSHHMFRTVSAQPSRCLKNVWYEVWTPKIITGKSLFLVLFCFSTHCQALCPHKHEYSAHTGVVHSQVWSHVAQVAALGVQRPLLVREPQHFLNRDLLYFILLLCFFCVTEICSFV